MVFAGTSGWAYNTWRPAFYPDNLPPKKFLQHYATRLNAVEVNYSFGHFISESALESWISDTPVGFLFCVKAHQSITHRRRLKNCGEPVSLFWNSIRSLESARKLGAILFQLPPNMKADAVLLGDFLSQFQELTGRAGRNKRPGARLRIAFEFRHTSWFQESVYKTLRSHKAALCIAESDELATPEVFTGNFVYFRLRRSTYSPALRRAIAANLRNHGAGKQHAFAFFRHEERPDSPLWAEEVLRRAGIENAKNQDGISR
ncbi:MAG: DUF72 domain-containing protein [Terriglobales bacterium]|jgi:uncharacterized protein YecE (DUF72 family)